jgi:hypothetical protein
VGDENEGVEVEVVVVVETERAVLAKLSDWRS